MWSQALDPMFSKIRVRHPDVWSEDMIDKDLDRRVFVKMGAGMISAVALAPTALALFKPLERCE